MNATETVLRARQRELLPVYDARAPRYTSYPTAVQFTPDVGPDRFGQWISELSLDEPVSIYAHIPFCARLCWYCGCNTRVIHRHESITDYMLLLREEIGMVRDRLPGRALAQALHLGGGTPNMLGPEDLDMLFAALAQAFDFTAGAEIAAELDPAQLTAEWTIAAAGHGLNRASLGVQDLSPAVQAAVNRHEPFEVVQRAAGYLHEAGVTNLNFDLMYGLPRQTADDVVNTLEQVLTLAPARVALFGYAHVPWMKPHQKLLPENELPDPIERLQQSQVGAERLAAAGYVQVGIDHFARPDDSMAVALAEGRLRRNFQGYTTDQAPSLIGFGASAISRLPQGLAQNQSQELLWRQAVGEGRLATARGVAISDDDRFRGEIIEHLMCELRVDLAAVADRYGRDVAELAPAVEGLAPMQADGLVERDGDTLQITELGRPFVRAACAQFDAYLNVAAGRHSQVV